MANPSDLVRCRSLGSRKPRSITRKVWTEWSSLRSAITCNKPNMVPRRIDAGPTVSTDTQLFEGRLPFGNAFGPVLATLLFRAGGVSLDVRQEPMIRGLTLNYRLYAELS